MKVLASQSPLNTIYLDFGQEELILNIESFIKLKIIQFSLHNSSIIIRNLENLKVYAWPLIEKKISKFFKLL